jgi:hypothetical protein
MERRVLLPLVDGFGRCHFQHGIESLINRLKEVLLVHEQIDVEQGGLDIRCFEGMAFAEWRSAPAQTYSQQFKERRNVGLIDSWGTSLIRESQTEQTIQFSFEPLLRTIPNASNFVRFVEPGARAASAGRLTADVEKLSGIQEHIEEKIGVVTARHRDSLDSLSAQLVADSISNACLIGDSLLLGDDLHGKFKSRFFALPDTPDSARIQEQVFSGLLQIRVPDFSRLTLEEIVELRQDALWTDFREFVVRLAHSLEKASDIDEVSIDDVFPALAKELMIELSARQPSGRKLVIDVALNAASLVPVFGAIATAASTGKAIKEYREGNVRWLSFLDRLAG